MKRTKLLIAMLICGLIATTAVFSIKYSELYNAYLSQMPPVSKREAIEIALEYGEWYEKGFEEMDVADVTLQHLRMLNNETDLLRVAETTQFLEPVTSTLPNYDKVLEGNWTYYYAWEVTLSQGYRLANSTMIAHAIPSDIYFIDASTGEVLPNFLILF